MQRRRFIIGLFVVVMFSAAAHPVAAQTLMVLGEKAELFMDDVNIHAQAGLTHTLHPGTKHPTPVLLPDKPWEDDRILFNGTVLRDEATGQFRMWYGGGGLAYATSNDGINWTKPQLPYSTHAGQPTNRLLTGNNLTFVIHDVQDPDPQYRYKLVDNIGTLGFRGWHSPDGLTWTRYAQDPLITTGSEMSNGFRDPATGKYHVFIRPRSPVPYPADDTRKRRVSVITSDDFVNWSSPQLILSPDATDDAWVTGPPQRTEFYGMSGFDYGNQYLGFVTMFRVTDIYDDPEPGQSQYEGEMDVQMVHSRNGLAWNRTNPRTTMIESGAPGSYDYSIHNIGTRPIVVGDEVWFYYNGLNTLHGGLDEDKVSVIALAKWRLDGFASLDAGASGGFVETALWTTEGDLRRLIVNADAEGGSVRVELVDESGNPLPGYTLADSIAITGDSVAHVARWASHSGLPEGESFRLRFHLDDASLFSYRVAAIPEPTALGWLAVALLAARPGRNRG